MLKWNFPLFPFTTRRWTILSRYHFQFRIIYVVYIPPLRDQRCSPSNEFLLRIFQWNFLFEVIIGGSIELSGTEETGDDRWTSILARSNAYNFLYFSNEKYKKKMIIIIIINDRIIDMKKILFLGNKMLGKM